MPDKKHIAFSGRLVIVGFGSIGQGVLPLLLRHIDMGADQIRVITAEARGAEVAAEYGVSFVETALTRENFRAVRPRLISTTTVNWTWQPPIGIPPRFPFSGETMANS